MQWNSLPSDIVSVDSVDLDLSLSKFLMFVNKLLVLQV